MSFIKNQNRYKQTQWPSPINGELMDEGTKFMSYNRVELEIPKTEANKQRALRFFAQNRYQHPNSDITNSYRIQFKSVPGTFQLYLNENLLTPEVQYSYNNSLQRVRFITLNQDKDYVGLITAKYTPADEKILYSEDIKRLKEIHGVIFKKIPTTYIYEILNLCRTAIHNIWLFLRVDPPIWVGGLKNQDIGRNNIIKFVTPVSVIHWKQVLNELRIINDFLNFRFNYNVNIRTEFDFIENQILKLDDMSDLVNIINSIELNLDDISKQGRFDPLLNKDANFL
jgi:hypothetical protein